jgi:hypothetical protein
VNNPYCYVLTHLKKVNKTKNIIVINIPDIAIFHSYQPYEIIFSENSEIKSLATKELRLKDVYNVFRNRWKLNNTPKEELSLACFESNMFYIQMINFLCYQILNYLLLVANSKTILFLRRYNI